MEYNFTIRKKDNGYQLILSYKVGMKWYQKSKQGFPTQSKARKYQLEMLEVVQKAVKTDRSLKEMTLSEFYLIRDSDLGLAPNTKALHKSVLRALGEVSEMPMSKITPTILMNALRPLKSSLSPFSYNNFLKVVKALFRSAVQYRIIAENPSESVPLMKIRSQRKPKTFTKAEISKMAAVLDPQDSTDCVIAIAIYTGMRLGEILALTVSDYDRDSQTISVTKQVTMKPDGTYGLAPLKTSGSMRTIPVPTKLRKFLNARKIVGVDGRFFTDKRITIRKRLRNRMKKAPFHGTIHWFRHTYATTLLASGADIKTVSALLGDTPSTVLKNYVDYTDDMRESAKELVNAL